MERMQKNGQANDRSVKECNNCQLGTINIAYREKFLLAQLDKLPIDSQVGRRKRYSSKLQLIRGRFYSTIINLSLRIKYL